MSQSESSQYPDKKAVSLYRSEHIETFEKALSKATEDMESDNPPETERIAHIAYSYLNDESDGFGRLRQDKRVQQAKKIVAKDHGVNPSDVSLANLLKITAGAYTGFQRTDDWDLQKNGESHD